MINSLENQRVKEVVKLHNKKYRKTTKKFIIEGKNIIQEAMALGVEVEVFSTEDNGFGTYVSDSVMRKMSNTETPPGLLGIASFPENKFYNNSPILICESIQDPGNVGTILRTALAFGFKNVIVDAKTADIFSPKVVRASKGAVFNLHIECVTDLSSKIFELKKSNEYTVIATSLDGVSMSNIGNSEKNFAVVFGNESKGISQEVSDLSDKKIKIEINEIESLNVAVAAGILLYNFRVR